MLQLYTNFYHNKSSMTKKIDSFTILLRYTKIVWILASTAMIDSSQKPYIYKTSNWKPLE